MSNFYKLVYIKGISNFDTWRFTSKQQQYNYFDGLQGIRIDDYYPPHYTNSIRFDKSDVDYSSDRYNYVLLYFDNKYYCYFIDDINYINEDVYELKLVKDTIQTYMFDVNFRYANVNRESIKRWIDIQNKIINRNYQRENLSKEEFFNVDYTEISNDSYGLIVQCSLLAYQSQAGSFLTNYEINDVTYVSGFYYLYIPLPYGSDATICQNFEFTVHAYDSSSQLIGTYTFTSEDIKELITEPNVINISVVNSSFMQQFLSSHLINYSVRTNQDGTKTYVEEVNYTATDKLNLVIASIGRSNVFAMFLKGLKADYIEYNYTLPISFEVNREINKPFHNKYIPQLLDENYYHFYFGEKINYSSYPLSKSNETIFKGMYYYDIFTGERNYKLSPESEKYYDKYNCNINATSREILELLNDPWKEYQSQNSASLTIGRALKPVSSAFSVASSLSGSVVNAGGRTDYKWHPKLKEFEYTGDFARSFAGPHAAAVSAVGNIVGDQLDYLVTKENLEHAPNTERQGNSYSSDVLNKSIKMVKSIECVKDIDNVAKLLEQFGYNVDKTYINTNIFNLNYRYYYNIIRCDNLQIDPVDCIIGNTDKNDFVSRFQKGLRLWNKDNNNEMYDNLQYDNVENDFIQE